MVYVGRFPKMLVASAGIIIPSLQIGPNNRVTYSILIVTRARSVVFDIM